MTWFCPEEFELSEKTIEWAKGQGLSTKQINDQLEAMKDYEYTKKRTDWEKCFRTWIRNQLAWGRITPSAPRQLFKPEPVTEEQRKRDREAFERDMARLGVRVIK